MPGYFLFFLSALRGDIEQNIKLSLSIKIHWLADKDYQLPAAQSQRASEVGSIKVAQESITRTAGASPLCVCAETTS